MAEHMDIAAIDERLRKRKVWSSNTDITPMYVHCTDNLAEAYTALSMEGKRIITIIGSGDHVLEAVYRGAREVLGYDINSFSLHMLALKQAAIEQLTRKEFITLLGLQEKNTFLDSVLFERLSSTLPEQSERFWRSLLAHYGFGEEVFSSPFIHDRSASQLDGVKVISYLANDEAYQRIKKNLSSVRIETYIDDVRQIPTQGDLLYLSNIPNVVALSDRARGEEFFSEIMEHFSNVLIAGGQVVFYQYSDAGYPNPAVSRAPPFNDREFCRALAARHGLSYNEHPVTGVFEGTDRILIFTLKHNL